MDFGIKAALITALNTIGDVSRGTGRTTWAIGEARRVGGVLAVASSAERELIRRRMRREPAGEIPIYVVSKLFHLIELQASIGLKSPIILDHHCHELLYREALTDVSERIGVYDKAYQARMRDALKHEIDNRPTGDPRVTLSPAAFAHFEDRRSHETFEARHRPGRADRL